MATPTNLPAAEVAGTSLPAAWLNDIRGAFRILQVVSAETQTQVASTSTTFVDTTLSATITPQSSTSKILVAYSQSIYTQGTGTGCTLKLLRGGTTLKTFADLSYGTNSGILVHHGFFELDSPATTSATTYKTQFCRGIGSATVYVQVNTTQNTSTMLLLEVSA